MSKRTIVILLLVSCGAFSALKLRLDGLQRETVPGSSIIYVPTGRHFKYATFGYSSLVADAVFLWSIQYFSEQKVTDRFDYLDHVYGIIAELDPRFIDAYLTGAIFAAYDARDMETCFKILDRGLEKNPDQWIFPFQAGHYAQILMKDYDLARKYYRQALNIPGAPDFTRRLYANAFYELSDYREALKHWLEIHEQAVASGDERVEKIASNHIYKNKAAIDLEALRGALDRYRERFGRLPSGLEELASADILSEIPRDLDGEDYEYDPETGEVRSQLWWKR